MCFFPVTAEARCGTLVGDRDRTIDKMGNHVAGGFPGRALGLADKVATRVARSANSSARASSGIDLAIAAAIAGSQGLQGIQDPGGYVEFLRTCWEPDVVQVERTLALRDAADEASLRFESLLTHLATGLGPIPADEAMRIGRIADALSASREPFDRPTYVTDVGVHAALSSSFGHSGRILTAAVRFLRPRQCLEIGTAYGLSASFLLASLARGTTPGHLATIECSYPQIDISFPMLQGQYSDRVTTYVGRSPDIFPEVIAAHGSLDFVFHDGEHTGEAYVTDFDALAPHLAAGAVLMFDDIRWEDPVDDRPAHCLMGWQRVVQHSRVRAAAELDGRYGLVLLR